MNENVKTNQMKIRITAFLLLLALFLLAGGGFLALIRDSRELCPDPDAPAPHVDQQTVDAWKKGVLSDNVQAAAFNAGQIVPDSNFQLPRAVYLDLFEDCGLNADILTGPWNPNDFRRWKQLLTNSEKSRGISSETELKKCLREAPEETMFDLARGCGYDVTVVRRLDVTPHTDLYEFRKGKKIFSIYPGDRTSVEKSAGELFGENAKLAYLYPASLADFRRFNILLFQRMEPYTGRLMKDPAQGLAELKEKYPDMTVVAFYPDLLRPKVTVR